VKRQCRRLRIKKREWSKAKRRIKITEMGRGRYGNRRPLMPGPKNSEQGGLPQRADEREGGDGR